MPAMRLCLVALATLAATLPASAQQLIASGRIGGRYDPATGFATLPVVVDWPSTSIWAAFEKSDTISVQFDLQEGYTAQLNTSLSFAVDGEEEVHFITSDQLPYTWSKSGLSQGAHDLQITKRTETLYGILVLQSITVSSGGSFLLPFIPEAYVTGRRILTVGDSIASGWANIGNQSCGSMTLGGIGQVLNPDTEDATRTFGALVADYFDADHQILAWSGAAQNPYPSDQAELLESVTTPTVPQLFSQLIAGNMSSVIANTSAWVPQIVIMEGGTNDFRLEAPKTSQEDWAQQYINFIRKVQGTYPQQPEIIVLAFSKEQQTVGILTDSAADTYLSYFDRLRQEVENQQIPNTHVLQLSGASINLTDWCAAHPSAEAHMDIAEQLIMHIEDFIPAFPNTTFASAVTQVQPVGAL